MFNSSILEVAMGMIFLYVLLSLLCSAAKEMISHILDMRAKNLEDGLTNILRSDKDQLVSEVYEHALIQGLSNKKKIPNDIKSLMEAIDKGPFKDTPR